MLIYFLESLGEPGCRSAALEGTGARRGERFASRRVCVEVTFCPRRQSFWRWLRPRPRPGAPRWPGAAGPGRPQVPLPRRGSGGRWRSRTGFGCRPGTGSSGAVDSLGGGFRFIFLGRKILSNLRYMFSQEGFWLGGGAGVPKLSDLQPPRGPRITDDYVCQLQKTPEVSALGPRSKSPRSWPVSHTRCRETVFLFTLPGSLCPISSCGHVKGSTSSAHRFLKIVSCLHPLAS